MRVLAGDGGAFGQYQRRGRDLPPPPLAGEGWGGGGVDDSEMFEVFNMGIGFCYVVDPADAQRTLAILKAHGRAPQVIGTAVSDAQKIVRIPARGLAGSTSGSGGRSAGREGWGDLRLAVSIGKSATALVIAGHSALKTRVNALMPRQSIVRAKCLAKNHGPAGSGEHMFGAK